MEEWRDDGPMRKQIGKAQPGSVLRNLLLRVWTDHRADWDELKDTVERWFSVELESPEYEKGVDTQIVCDYREKKERYDIIAGGSGFHQALTLLAFLYGYKPTTILFDEPDAHLHVNLQREMLEYLRERSDKDNVQCLIATHAEEFIKGVAPRQVVSLLNRRPVRIESTEAVLTAMAEVSNMEVAQLRNSPVMLYVEGESDERILRAWGHQCSADNLFDKVCIHYMGGGRKSQMQEAADRHFDGVGQIVPASRRVVLFDFDSDEAAFHPMSDNPVLVEWKRKNMENYLLVPPAWKRAAATACGGDLFAQPAFEIVQRFFEEENLVLPPRQTWRGLRANVFSVVDGKKLLFEAGQSLFRRLQAIGIELTPQAVASHMEASEIHEDVHLFFAKLRAAVTS